MLNPLEILWSKQDLLTAVNQSTKIPLKIKNELRRFVLQYHTEFNNEYNKGNYNNEAVKNLKELQKIIYNINDVQNIKFLTDFVNENKRWFGTTMIDLLTGAL